MSYYIAVGTSNGENVDLKFGEVEKFYIYCVDGKDVKLAGIREAEKNPARVPGNRESAVEDEPACSPGSCGSARSGSVCSGNGQGCSGPDEILGKVETISDCRCVVCKKVGFRAQKQFEKKAISVFDVECSVSEALEKITSYYFKIDNRQSLRKTEG